MRIPALLFVRQRLRFVHTSISFMLAVLFCSQPLHHLPILEIVECALLRTEVHGNAYEEQGLHNKPPLKHVVTEQLMTRDTPDRLPLIRQRFHFSGAVHTSTSSIVGLAYLPSSIFTQFLSFLIHHRKSNG